MTVEDLATSFDPNGHIEIVSTPIFLIYRKLILIRMIVGFLHESCR